MDWTRRGGQCPWTFWTLFIGLVSICFSSSTLYCQLESFFLPFFSPLKFSYGKIQNNTPCLYGWLALITDQKFRAKALFCKCPVKWGLFLVTSLTKKFRSQSCPVKWGFVSFSSKLLKSQTYLFRLLMHPQNLNPVKSNTLLHSEEKYRRKILLQVHGRFYCHLHTTGWPMLQMDGQCFLTRVSAAAST